MRRPTEFAAQICDMYINGTSTRKVKKALKAVAGDKIKMSKSTVSRITKTLVEEFKAWKKKDLSELRVSCLFFDAIRIGENILDAVPKENQQELRKKLNTIFHGATSLEQAKLFIKDFKKDYGKKFPSAISILESDLDQCLTFYLFPRNHWLKIRTSNKLERLNLEIRRRLNVIGRHPSEEGCLGLIYQVAKNYSYPQQRVMVNDIIRKLWIKVKEDRLAMIEQLQLDLFAA